MVPLTRRDALGLAIALGLLPARASSRQMVLAVHGPSPAGKAMAADLARLLPACQAVEFIPGMALPARTVALALGPDVLRGLLASRTPASLVSLFTSQSTFSRLATDPAHTYPGRQLTAVYAETSAQSQLELIANIYRRRVSVALPLAGSPAWLPALERLAKTLNLELRAHTLLPGETVSSASSDLHADVVLLTPEAGQLSSESVRALLESTYRRAQPVIGYSAALVSAGTVASTHATVEDVANQVADLLDQIDAGRLPPAAYPTHWHVASNATVARSLDIALPASLTGVAR